MWPSSSTPKGNNLLSPMLLHVLPLLLAAPVAVASSGRRGHGFIGYGINMYNPLCASSCGSAISKHLYCPPKADNDHHEGMIMKRHGADHSEPLDTTPNKDGWLPTKSPSPECVANSTAYLQSIAWCMYTHCPDSLSPAEREAWWWSSVVGRKVPQPDPVLTYQQALASVHAAPNATAGRLPLSTAVLVDDETFAAQMGAQGSFQKNEKTHAKYGIIIASTCAALPIALSFLRFVPFSGSFFARFRSTFIHAPMPLAPKVSRGQALFMTYMVAINVALSFAGITIATPNAWWDTTAAQVTTFIANRAGVLSFANLPLAILFAGRNNFLLWLTNWSYTTFLLLHRCAAIIAVIQACLHSAMYLQIYLAQGAAAHAVEAAEKYWYWGIIATLAMSLLLPLSIRAVRSAAYEIFLIGHIALAILTIAGCWWHIIFRFSHQWGYETWLYVAMGVWGFDRLFRILRILTNGVRYAAVYKVDDDYLRLDIENTHVRGHVFAYFPTITYRGIPRPWENHPFSIAAYNSEPPKLVTAGSETGASMPIVSCDSEKGSSSVALDAVATAPPRSVTIFVRVCNGLTARLAARAISPGSVPRRLPILLEGSYGHESTLVSETPSDLPDMLFIAGGVGITALLPRLLPAAVSPERRGAVALHWGVRTAPLVHAVEEVVAQHSRALSPSGAEPWGAVDTHISVGTRLFLTEIIENQVKKSAGTVVYVSGPAGMVEEARALVAQHARAGAIVHFSEEMFEW